MMGWNGARIRQVGGGKWMGNGGSTLRKTWVVGLEKGTLKFRATVRLQKLESFQHGKTLDRTQRAWSGGSGFHHFTSAP